MKLTKPQTELLADLAEVASVTGVTTYPPAMKLVAHGLARWEEGAFSDRLVITPAGRALLTLSKGEKP